MNCSVCGSQLEYAGQGHTCAGGPVAAVGPPRRWQIAFWAVLLAAVVLAAVSLLRAAIGASPDGLPVTALAIAAPALLLVTFVVWSNVTKGLVEGYGGMVAVVRNWAMSAGGLILFLAYLLPTKVPTAFHFARAAGAILLVVGLLISRGKLQRWLIAPAAPPADNPPQGQVPTPRRGSLSSTPPAEPQPQDWDASPWDPGIQADIERRRHRT